MIVRFLKNAFYWQYERGSLPWDISCVVFIIIIFSTPHDFLMNYTRHPLTPSQIHDIVKTFFASLL